MDKQHGEALAWPARTWMLAALGAFGALLIHFLTDDFAAVERTGQACVGLAAAVGVAALAIGYTLERTRLISTLVFAGLCALVLGTVVYWNMPGDGVGSDGWRVLCAVVAVGIAAPLFQAWRDGQDAGAPLRWRSSIAYPTVHDRAWTDAVLWIAAWIFVGVVWLLAFLLSELFQLIGIDVIKNLLRQGWFAMVMTGAAVGAAIGLLRDRTAVLSTLQRVVMTVLSVLAPILGVGLALFVIALPFTGLAPLWEATRSTTPILIGSVAAAIILVNAVLGDSSEDESRVPPLRIGAMLLGGTMLVLAVIAAVSTQARIGQYGYTPDRLWAVVFSGLAIAYGLAYVAALAMGRAAWAVLVRRFNLRLAFGVCALALVLSTPFVSFGAISARDQVARLESGRVNAAKFDWQAMWYDFGPAGRDAMRRLARSSKADIRQAAKDIQATRYRWDAEQQDAQRARKDTLKERLQILPKGAVLPPLLREEIARSNICGETGPCIAIIAADRAVMTGERCEGCGVDRVVLYRRADKWTQAGDAPPVVQSGAERTKAKDRKRAALEKGQLEIRSVTRDQLFVDGEPVGEPFR